MFGMKGVSDIDSRSFNDYDRFKAGWTSIKGGFYGFFAKRGC